MPPPADPTRLALDRTVLANERTYAAWIRTGLAALAAGLGLARLMLNTMPLWSIRILAMILISFSAGAFLLSSWRYEHLHVAIAHLDVKTIPVKLVKLFSLLLALCSILALVGLWLISP